MQRKTTNCSEKQIFKVILTSQSLGAEHILKPGIYSRSIEKINRLMLRFVKYKEHFLLNHGSPGPLNSV